MRKRSEITERLTVGEPAHRLKQVRSAIHQLKTPAEVLQAIKTVLKQARAVGLAVVEATDESEALIITVARTKSE